MEEPSPKEQPRAGTASHAAIEEVPTRTATDQFKAAGNVPPVVASRYYDSIGQRQARIRERLLAISGKGCCWLDW
jgi:hypothetical protein